MSKYMQEMQRLRIKYIFPVGVEEYEPEKLPLQIHRQGIARPIPLRDDPFGMFLFTIRENRQVIDDPRRTGLQDLA